MSASKIKRFKNSSGSSLQAVFSIRDNMAWKEAIFSDVLEEELREKKEKLNHPSQALKQSFPRFSSALTHPGQSPHFQVKRKEPEDGSRNAGMHPQQQKF